MACVDPKGDENGAAVKIPTTKELWVHRGMANAKCKA